MRSPSFASSCTVLVLIQYSIDTYQRCRERVKYISNSSVLSTGVPETFHKIIRGITAGCPGLSLCVTK